MLNTQAPRPWVARGLLARLFVCLVVLPMMLASVTNVVVSSIRACDATFKK